MPRYEYSDDKSNKFWEIERSGSEVTTTWGRIGTDGASKTKDFGSDGKAEKEYAKLVSSKTKKGYTLVGKRKKAAAKKATTKKATTKKAAAKKATTKKATTKKATTKKAATKKATKPKAAPTKDAEGWQRYEFVKGGSAKYWEVKVDGSRYTTRYGRIGDDKGKETTKAAGSALAAKKEAEKLAASKVKKGYVLTVAGALGGAAALAPSNPSLEKAIAKKMDDVERYLVYGDWLQGEEDPRGELITVQAGLLDDPKGKTLRKTEDKLLKANAEHFFGPVHPELRWGKEGLEKPKRKKASRWNRREGTPEELWAYGHFMVDWYCGFARGLWFEPGYYAEGKKTDDCVAILAEFIDHPSARFLREIHVGDVWIDDWEGPDMTAVARLIAGSKIAGQLTAVEFIGGDHDISGVSLDASAIPKACKNLERLAIYGGDVNLGRLDLPKLKSFRVVTGGLAKKNIKEICNAKWPNLEHLEIYFGSSNYGASGGIKDIGSILDARGLKKVRSLGLRNAEFTDDICREIVRAPILKQLTQLDLSMGTMGRAGAQALLDGASKLKKLEQLSLEDNFIPKEQHKDLKKLAPKVELGYQDNHDDDGDDRYVSLAE